MGSLGSSRAGSRATSLGAVGAAVMSWHDSMAGKSIPLSCAARERLGVNGFGADDIGVLKNAEFIASTVDMGIQHGAVSKEALESFLHAGQGTVEQAQKAELLVGETLVGIKRSVDEEVSKQLAGCSFGAATTTYDEYLQWAGGCGWELSFGVVDPSEEDKGLYIVEGAGLALLECPVTKVDGLLGSALHALLGLLCHHAFKATSLEVMGAEVGMFVDIDALASKAEKNAMITQTDITSAEWLEKLNQDAFDELSFYEDDDPSVVESAAQQIRDLAMATLSYREHVGAVHSTSLSLDNTMDRMAACNAIRDALLKASPCALRDFGLQAIMLVADVGTASSLRAVVADTYQDQWVGRVSAVMVGESITGGEDLLNQANRSSMEACDEACLPILGNVADVSTMLVNITVAERLLVGFCALVEQHLELSEEKAA